MRRRDHSQSPPKMARTWSSSGTFVFVMELVSARWQEAVKI